MFTVEFKGTSSGTDASNHYVLTLC